MSKPVNTIYTIGHSTRAIDDFINLVKAYKVEMIVDVRTIAGSEYNPQYNEESLNQSLGKQHISYLHLKELGGLRHTTKVSVNTAWKNLSFRGYADYMQTPEFTKGIDDLIKHAKEKQVAIMCAEAVPWRCHRCLIADALTVRNIRVIDIISEKSSMFHKMTPFARVKGHNIMYPMAE